MPLLGAGLLEFGFGHELIRTQMQSLVGKQSAVGGRWSSAKGPCCRQIAAALKTEAWANHFVLPNDH
jgi:hypothetical protein